MVGAEGIEPPTYAGYSGYSRAITIDPYSHSLARVGSFELPMLHKAGTCPRSSGGYPTPLHPRIAVHTGFEPVIFCVTGRRGLQTPLMDQFTLGGGYWI